MEHDLSFTKERKERENVEATVTAMLAEALARQIAAQVIESVKLAG